MGVGFIKLGAYLLGEDQMLTNIEHRMRIEAEQVFHLCGFTLSSFVQLIHNFQ